MMYQIGDEKRQNEALDGIGTAIMDALMNEGCTMDDVIKRINAELEEYSRLVKRLTPSLPILLPEKLPTEELEEGCSFTGGPCEVCGKSFCTTDHEKADKRMRDAILISEKPEIQQETVRVASVYGRMCQKCGKNPADGKTSRYCNKCRSEKFEESSRKVSSTMARKRTEKIEAIKVRILEAVGNGVHESAELREMLQIRYGSHEYEYYRVACAELSDGGKLTKEGPIKSPKYFMAENPSTDSSSEIPPVDENTPESSDFPMPKDLYRSIKDAVTDGEETVRGVCLYIWGRVPDEDSDTYHRVKRRLEHAMVEAGACKA